MSRYLDLILRGGLGLAVDDFIEAPRESEQALRNRLR